MTIFSVHLWTGVLAGKLTSEALPHLGKKVASYTLQELSLELNHPELPPDCLAISFY